MSLKQTGWRRDAVVGAYATGQGGHTLVAHFGLNVFAAGAAIQYVQTSKGLNR